MTISEYLRRAEYTVIKKRGNVFTLFDKQTGEIVTKTVRELAKTLQEHEETIAYYKGETKWN